MVNHGQTLTVMADPELFDHVFDPQGDPLQFNGIQGAAVGGELTSTADGFIYRAYAGSTLLSSVHSDAPQPSQGGAVVYLQHRSGLDSSLMRYDAATDSVAALITRNENSANVDALHSLTASPHADAIWVLESPGGRALRITNAGGIAVGVPAGLQDMAGTVIVPGSGDLLYCGQNNEWRGLRADSAAGFSTGLACQSANARAAVKRGDEVCFEDLGRLWCASDADGLAEVHNFNADVMHLLVRGEELLAFVQNATDDTLDVWAVSASNAVSRVSRFDESFATELSHATLSDGTLVFPVEVGDELRLAAWRGLAAGAPEFLTEAVAPFPNRLATGRPGGGLVFDADNEVLWWYLPGGDGTYLLYRVLVAPVLSGASGGNGPAGTGSLATVEIVRPIPTGTVSGNTPSRLVPRDDGVILGQTVSSDECRFVHVDDSANLTNLIDSALCEDPVLVDGRFIYRRPRHDGVPQMLRFDGAPLVGVDQFTATIGDDQGNAVSLPINMTVSAP